MSTNATETEQSPQQADDKPEGTETHDASESPANEPETQQDDTFSRAYVEELRTEAAKHRINAKKSDELSTRLVTALVTATGRLHDPLDLAASADLMDDDGFPDPDKITSAVEALIQERPHLARIRPVGDVGQGVTGDSTTGGLAAFGNMLRDAAS